MKSKPNYLNEISIDYCRKLFSIQQISTSKDAATIAREMYEHSDSRMDLKEYFFVMFLNKANKVCSYYKVSEGGISQTVVDLKLVFGTALKCLASAMILVHNHPSGNLKASKEDMLLTKRFINAAQLLDIVVLDHVIITSDDHYSLGDNGEL